jgi:transposase
MHRFIDGEDRMPPALLPHTLEDYVSEESPVRVIEVFIDDLQAARGFGGFMVPGAGSALGAEMRGQGDFSMLTSG